MIIVTFAASLSERRRYCGCRRLSVYVSVFCMEILHQTCCPAVTACDCECLPSCDRTCPPSRDCMRQHRISLRGEGYSLYPVLSSKSLCLCSGPAFMNTVDVSGVCDVYVRVFLKGVYSSSWEPPQSYKESLAVWDHSVTCHPTQVNVPRRNPSQTGRYSIYLPRRNGRLS